MVRTLVLASMMTLALVASAEAHFIWLVVDEAGAETPAVRLFFGEGPEPGEAFLVDRMKPAEVHALTAEGDRRLVLENATEPDAETGAMAASWGETRPQAAVASLRYGVFTRGDSSMLLNYYSKYLDATPEAISKLAKSERLALDVVPHRNEDGTIWVEVFFQGKPVEGAQVVDCDPLGETTLEPQAGKSHAFTWGQPKPGLRALRVRLSQDEAGEENGQPYSKILHYHTLVMRVPDAKPEGESANDLLGEARDNRATWANFPGFTATIRASSGEGQGEGTISVTKDGEVTITGMPKEIDERVGRTMRSMIGHRLADSNTDTAGEFGDAVTTHPLGRLIGVEGDAMGSSYRVQDGVMRQVNRTMGQGKFTISVLDVYRNPENKTLPKLYTVSFWNADGTLRNTNTIRDEWTRVGSIDLPTLHLRVEAGKEGIDALQIEMSDHKLLSE